MSHYGLGAHETRSNTEVELIETNCHGLEKNVKPTKIDWTNTIPFKLDFGPDFDAPTYGKYGGPQISGPGLPIDKLDALFMAHDQEIIAAIINDGQLEPSELVQPHANLINGILGLEEAPTGRLMVDEIGGEPQGDAEATLYSGFTILALTADLVQYGLLDELETALDPQDPMVFDDVPAALEEAGEYVAKALSSGKPLKEAFDLFDKAYDELLDRQDALTSTSDWGFIA
jgi:hypothetical protein